MNNKYKNIYLDDMTRELALAIKEIRGHSISLRHSTWRSVADQVAEKYPDLKVCPGNQMEGQELCKAAWLFLGDEEEWF